MLSFALKPNKLQENWLGTNWRVISENILLLDVDVPDSVGVGFGVFNILGDTQNPLFSLLPEVVIDIQKLVNDIDNGLDTIALIHS